MRECSTRTGEGPSISMRTSDIAHQFVESLNRRDLAAFAQLFDKDRYTWHGPAGEVWGPGNFSPAGPAAEFEAFPDISYHIEEVVAEGDKVVMRLIEPATHTGGAIWGISPKGRRVTLRNTVILRIENDKIVEEWDSYDMLSILLQLGATPAELIALAGPAS